MKAAQGVRDCSVSGKDPICKTGEVSIGAITNRRDRCKGTKKLREGFVDLGVIAVDV